MEDELIITYDSCPPDVPTLMIARSNGRDMTILNQFQGDAAFAIYCLLNGSATMEYKKMISEVTFQLKCIKEHLKFVSKTIDKSVDFDIQVLDTCISQLEEDKYGVD